MKLKQLRFVVLALAAVYWLPVSAATPTIGQTAPALTFTELLQAPACAKTDWPSLRGKVVVLEFWATWCAGCIEEVPHLNSLIQSLGAAPVQFIAVDDEEPAVAKKFLAKLPMSGWLGFDTSKKVIDAYGVTFRPLTVVIDAQGRVAAILKPNQLNKEQLIALASGKPAVFPTDETTAIAQQTLKEVKAADANTAAAAKPLFEISIRPGDPAGQAILVERPSKLDSSYSFDYRNATLSDLLSTAGGVQASRLAIHGGANARYTLHVNAPVGDLQQLAPALEMAIVTAAEMKLSHVAAEEDAYVLQATPKAAGLLSPATSKKESMCFYDKRAGKLVMLKSSLDDLAQTLEYSLRVPVVNEAGMPGEFDANFDLPKVDAETAKAALEKNLGLTLVKARRKIDRIVLDAPAQKP